MPDMDTHVIRPVAAGDDEALARIIRNSLEEFGANKPGTVYYDETTDRLSDIFLTPNSLYLVAEHNDVILGGAGIFPTENLPEGVCELVKLYLSAEARGKGIGQQLLKKCLDAAKDMGYRKVYLESMPELTIALPLYEKWGFRYLDGPMGNSGHCGCDIWMIKDLGS